VLSVGSALTELFSWLRLMKPLHAAWLRWFERSTHSETQKSGAASSPEAVE
jgi:hypothetical protein